MTRLETTPDDSRLSWWILTVNTLAFTVCFAVWMMNGVLVTYLVDTGVYRWDAAQIGWLIGIPVITGSLFLLPLSCRIPTVSDRWASCRGSLGRRWVRWRSGLPATGTC